LKNNLTFYRKALYYIKLSKMIRKGYKFRIYPNKEQEELLKKHFGATRFIYNYLLDLKIKEYQWLDEMIQQATIGIETYRGNCWNLPMSNIEPARDSEQEALPFKECSL